MTKSLRLTVRTPAATLREIERIEWVHARLADGRGITVYPGHARLLAETVEAPIRYADGSGEHIFCAEEGILEVDQDAVTIFTKGESESEKERPTAVASEERRFERLARELKDRLNRDSEGSLWRLLTNGSHDEQT